MIPVKLYLHNFMAYKTPAMLDFDGIHVACLTGENGAGKSSLLDAITWVLWGKARTRSDDDLIHLGESEMEVEYTFNLGEEIYKILRRRTSTKRGKSELHFQMADGQDWRTLTESSIRTTQEKIDRLLRLDYNTFINSAFLLQGRADEFTTRSPRDRKQILGDILGLSMYDDYETKAKNKVRHYEQEIKIVEGQLTQMAQEMGFEKTYQQEWDQSQIEATRLHKALREVEDKLNTLRQHYKELDLKQQQRRDLEARLQEAQTDLTDLQQTTSHLTKQIAAHQHIIDQKAAIETGYNQWQTAQEAQEEWQEKLAQFSTLSAEQHRLQRLVDEAKASLEGEIKVLHSRLGEMTPKIEAIPTMQSQLDQYQADLEALEAIETDRDANRQKLNDLNTETARLEEENKQLKGEMTKIRTRLTQLEEAGSTCPICTQPLNEDHRAKVKDQFTTEGTLRGDTYRTNKDRLKAIVTEQKTLEATIKTADKTLRTRSRLQSQHAKTEQQLQEAEKAKTETSTLTEKLEAHQQTLASNEYETASQAKLKQLTTRLTDIGYNDAAHKASKAETSKLAPYAEKWRQLQDAETRLKEAQTSLNREQDRLNRLLKQTEKDRNTVAELTEATQTLPALGKQLSQTSQQVDTLQREERLARDAVAAARQKLDHLAYLAKEKGNKEAELADLKGTQGIYKELRAAFGKKGVQALLIEHTIPELEDEANKILSQMTDGRVNLQFITQREAKSTDNVIETLDIRIADELGTRNYDLYSGGEAFRVNFAIRIALSKLLARRAGANLQTLVIDEGFGTQDAQGRERLVEAIKIIQKDFEKIIVITHIEELKEAFPIRIHVQKTAEGSKIRLD